MLHGETVSNPEAPVSIGKRDKKYIYIYKDFLKIHTNSTALSILAAICTANTHHNLLGRAQVVQFHFKELNL